MEYDLIVRDGRLIGSDGPTDIAVADGRIRRLGEGVDDGRTEIDADGGLVAAGQDNLRDAFYQYNRCDMLETAHLLAHAAHLQGPTEPRGLWAMVAEAPATILDVDHGVAPERRAVFNIYDPSITSPTDALRARMAPQAVVHDGAVVAETTVETSVTRH